MSRRRAYAALAVAAAVGAVMVAAGVVLATAGAFPDEAGDLEAHKVAATSAGAYATAGLWAELRGLVTSRTWMTRPDRLVRAIVARLAGAPAPLSCREADRLVRGDLDDDLAALALYAPSLRSPEDRALLRRLARPSQT
jgi:hypothetical protein